MKVALLNTLDIEGGAARAVYRLLGGLRSAGADPHMVVQHKLSHDPKVNGSSGTFSKIRLSLRSQLDRMPLWLYPRRQSVTWSQQWLPNNSLKKRIHDLHPDIVHLHWIARGFVPVKLLPELNYPLVWTLHDMWAFTGGCHYDQQCNRWQEKCGSCPQLISNRENDRTRKTLENKKILWRNLRINFITPSHWLANCVRSSPLFQGQPLDVIPNGIDTTTFSPTDKIFARRHFNLPNDKAYIVFGALNSLTDERKGFRYLQETLQYLSVKGWKSKVALAIFGASQPKSPPDYGLKSYYLGSLNDERSLALAYSAGDVFLAPSLQDNLPNTVMEALACGNPSVAFNIGGMPDMIDHKISGYLAQPFDTVDLAHGIEWILGDKQRYQTLCEAARRKVLAEFSLDLQAKKHLELYNKILSEKKQAIHGQ